MTSELYFYGRGTDKDTKKTASALQNITIGRKRDDRYEICDLASIIFHLKDRIEALEKEIGALRLLS